MGPVIASVEIGLFYIMCGFFIVAGCRMRIALKAQSSALNMSSMFLNTTIFIITATISVILVVY
jgi:hypothetical protein